MLCSSTWLSTLVVVLYLTHASPRAHPRRPQTVRRSGYQARNAPTSIVGVPLQDLQDLQLQYSTFHRWIEVWLASAQPGDTTYAAQLEQEFVAYDAWVTNWLNNIMDGASTPSVAISTLPIVSLTLYQSQGFVNALSSSTAFSTLPQTTAPTPTSGAQAVISSAPVSISLNQSPAQPTTSISGFGSSIDAIVPSSSASFNGSGDYVGSSKSLAVYYGASAATASMSLESLCQDQNVDIVLLAFLTSFSAKGYPRIDIAGNGCGAASTAAIAKGATDLFSCPILAKDIATCQGLGKKVMLSIGGASAPHLIFSGDDQAKEAANMLWNLFGAGTGEDAALRPFGKITLDGFDVDTENKITTGWNAFVSALRSAMNEDRSRQYYISAAPQCPRPDESIPLDAMKEMDFVFVQFYNNGDCDVGQDGFINSLKSWSTDLGPGPKLYIGAPGCPACAGKGYLDPKTMQSTIQDAMKSGVNGLGGVVLWDGPMAKENAANGKSYLDVVKSAMG